MTSSVGDRRASCGPGVPSPVHGNTEQPAVHLPKCKQRGGKGAQLLCIVVKIYMKPHMCKLKIGSFYHQACTACKYELCKTINYLIIRGSSCRGCSEDTASAEVAAHGCSVSACV